MGAIQHRFRVVGPAGRGPGKICLALLILFLSLPVQAQRHPESAGPVKLFREEPGLVIRPSWQRRLNFNRGSKDRYERGRARMFLNAEDSVPYLNYAEKIYFTWNRSGSRGSSPRVGQPWDRMGNYIGSGSRAFSWEESRSNGEGGISSIGGGSSLRIGHYNHKALHWSVTTGKAIRNRFTSLTLHQARMSVARMDLNYKDRDQATLLFNRGREGGLFSTWDFNIGRTAETAENATILMYAGHWQHALGDFGHIGATFLNQFQSLPASPNRDALRGDLSYPMLPPDIIWVQISDDSPEETQANARVYGVDLIIEGERNGEPVRLTTIEGDENFDANLARGRSRTGGRFVPGGGWEAVGQDEVLYQFAMPQDVTVRSARFVAEVSDDYRIGVRQQHVFINRGRDGEEDPEDWLWPATPLASEGRRAFKGEVLFLDEEPFYTVRRAGGTGSNGGNRQKVGFDYGMPTGQILASVDWNADLVGLSLSGEAVQNLQNYLYPIGGSNEGTRSTQKAWAWWIKAVKDFPGGLQAGAELYRLEPDYSGGYDSKRGGLPFHLDFQAQPGSPVQSVTQEYFLIEDNDDTDQWPDEHFFDQPKGGWPDSEVYPGLDENGDNIPDIDNNLNFIPDWQEPFLMYDLDPVEFVYGIDFNNNGLPDFRENDDLPDYPYRRDQRGRHLFARFNRLGGLGHYVSLGYYNLEEIANPGQAKALYLRYAYELNLPDWGRIGLDYDVKKVEDDIRDDSFIWVVAEDDRSKVNLMDGPPGIPGRERPATPDPLLMRDSWVNTVYLNTRVGRLENLNIQNSFLLIRNNQAEIELDDGTGLLQEEDTRSHFTLINKIDYTWEKGALTVHPKFKHMLQRDGMGSAAEPIRSYSDFIPILRADYALTEKTRILSGIQGFPLLPYKRWDRIQEDATFAQRDYMIVLNSRSEYWGHDASIFWGFHATRKEYSQLQERDIEDHRIFMDIVVGY